MAPFRFFRPLNAVNQRLRDLLMLGNLLLGGRFATGDFPHCRAESSGKGHSYQRAW